MKPVKIEYFDSSEGKIKIPNSIISYSISGDEFSDLAGFFGVMEIEEENPYIPTSVTYNPPATICIFPDGEKVVAKCTEGDAFLKENGVMACIVKKIFGSRSQFMNLVEKGYDAPLEKAKKAEEIRKRKEAYLKRLQDIAKNKNG